MTKDKNKTGKTFGPKVKQEAHVHEGQVIKHICFAPVAVHVLNAKAVGLFLI